MDAAELAINLGWSLLGQIVVAGILALVFASLGVWLSHRLSRNRLKWAQERTTNLWPGRSRALLIWIVTAPALMVATCAHRVGHATADLVASELGRTEIAALSGRVVLAPLLQDVEPTAQQAADVRPWIASTGVYAATGFRDAMERQIAQVEQPLAEWVLREFSGKIETLLSEQTWRYDRLLKAAAPPGSKSPIPYAEASERAGRALAKYEIGPLVWSPFRTTRNSALGLIALGWAVWAGVLWWTLRKRTVLPPAVAGIAVGPEGAPLSNGGAG